MKKNIPRVILLLLALTILTACAAKVAQPSKRFFWPPEPDEPRVEWIATYFSDLDVKEKSFLSELVGDDSLIRFKRPMSVASDGEGRFVVSDQLLGQAFMFDLNTRTVAPLGAGGEAAYFKLPTGVTVDGEGNFYVADTGTRKVYVVNSQNSILRVLDISEHVKSIAQMTVDRVNKTLVAADAKGAKLFLFSLTGELRSTVDGKKGDFNYPNAVAVLSDGSMVIADAFNAKVVHVSAAGEYIKSIGRRGDTPGDLALVTSVAVDSEDHIYTTDGRNHNLTIFDKEGNTLLSIGGPHSVASGTIGRGGFQVPQGISIDKNDRIYVADSLNKRVQVLQYLNARYLREHPVVKSMP